MWFLKILSMPLRAAFISLQIETEGKLNPWYILKDLLQPTQSCIFFPLYSWQIQYHRHLAEEIGCIGHALSLCTSITSKMHGSC